MQILQTSSVTDPEVPSGAESGEVERKQKPDNVNVAARYGVLKVPLLIQDV